MGGDAIREKHIGISADRKMIHHLANPIIELTSDSTATAIHRYESHQWFPAGEPVQYMHNFGVYHETYIRLDDGQWYIQTMKLERLRVECR